MIIPILALALIGGPVGFYIGFVFYVKSQPSEK